MYDIVHIQIYQCRKSVDRMISYRTRIYKSDIKIVSISFKSGLFV
jgi:hypothetical protein